MTSKDAILHALQISSMLADRLTADLSREELHHRVVPEANCAAWILGHLIVGERRALARLGVAPEVMPTLPFDDFEQRFAQNEPAPKAQDYGQAELLPPSFAEHRNALISAVRAADESRLDEALPRPMPPLGATVGESLAFTPVHVAMHMGQISTIRRSLGRPPVF